MNPTLQPSGKTSCGFRRTSAKHVLARPFFFLIFLLFTPVIPTLCFLFIFRNAPCQLFAPLSSTNGLTVITLTYNQTSEDININHNCRMIANSPHHYLIYTDNLNSSYCSLCQCRLYSPARCHCPSHQQDACKRRNPCEKLWFIIDTIAHFKQFVFLDNDLVILRREFLDHLQARSRVHDFLATYGHLQVKSTEYRRNFNSGLLFIRRKDHLNYSLMKKMMYDMTSMSDQGVISAFVQQNYNNWDTLSYKWHCRLLSRSGQDIPPSHCYTIHDRRDVEIVLDGLNITRMKIA